MHDHIFIINFKTKRSYDNKINTYIMKTRQLSISGYFILKIYTDLFK